MQQRKADEAAKLDALRGAARVGFAAFDRGEFRAFDSAEELEAYLYDLSEKIISRVGK